MVKMRSWPYETIHMKTRDLAGGRVINQSLWKGNKNQIWKLIYSFLKEAEGDLSLTHGVESSEYESKAKADEENIVVPEHEKIKNS